MDQPGCNRCPAGRLYRRSDNSSGMIKLVLLPVIVFCDTPPTCSSSSSTRERMTVCLLSESGHPSASGFTVVVDPARAPSSVPCRDTTNYYNRCPLAGRFILFLFSFSGYRFLVPFSFLFSGAAAQDGLSKDQFVLNKVKTRLIYGNNSVAKKEQRMWSTRNIMKLGRVLSLQPECCRS